MNAWIVIQRCNLSDDKVLGVFLHKPDALFMAYERTSTAINVDIEEHRVISRVINYARSSEPSTP